MLAPAAAPASPTEQPHQPHAGGRPTKFTPDTIMVLLAALRAGNRPQNACLQAGISYTVYREWIVAGEAGDPKFAEFVDEVHKAEASAESKSLSRILKAAETDWKADAWYMARRFGWVDESRLTVDHTGTVTNSIEITVLTSNDLGGIAGLLGTGTPGRLPPGDVIDQEPDPQP